MQIGRGVVGQRRLLILAPIILCSFIVIGTVIWLALFSGSKLTSEDSVRKYYSQKTQNLYAAVEAIPSSSNNPEKMSEELDIYNNKLLEIAGICMDITNKNNESVALNIPQALKDSTGEVKLLCSDLVNVVTYSQTTYRSLRPYLMLETGEWPLTDNDSFKQQIRSIQQTAQTSRDSLAKVDNTKIQDPAMSELSVQIDLTITLAKEAMLEADQGNHAQAAELADKLSQQINQDKSDFLNARSYFWNNTIGIAQLLEALRDTQEAISVTKTNHLN